MTNSAAVETNGSGDLVCVTGAAGFIGSHAVLQLLKRGKRVRATVRDAKDQKKTAHLLGFGKQFPGQLELVSADLMDKAPWPDVVKGCTHVYHIASAVYLKAKDHSAKSLTRP